MRLRRLLLLSLSLAVPVCAQESYTPLRPLPGQASALNTGANLPIARIGVEDLIGITVYDAPELTGTVRVNPEGDVSLPILRQHVHVAGLYPEEVQAAIASALVSENVLVNPIVTVSVAEYRSRPITVAGAVKKPTTFQATGETRLLDAISHAEGLAQNAGPEILVLHPSPRAGEPQATERISVKELMSGSNNELNIKLDGGEEVRIPEAGRVFVLGRVKKPGAFYITDPSQSSVLRAISLSEGLDSFPAKEAYILRTDAQPNASPVEIPVALKKILERKSPDVPLLPNDVLYVPESSGTKAGLKALETAISTGSGLGSALIYYSK